jgi:hypothetical protein
MPAFTYSLFPSKTAKGTQCVLIGDGGIYPKPGAGKEPSVAIHLGLQNAFKYVVAYSIGILFLTATTSCSYPLQTMQN